MGSNKWEMILPSKVRQKKIILRNLDIVVWTSGFHNPLVHTGFNMFVDEWMSANESPVRVHCQLMICRGHIRASKGTLKTFLQLTVVCEN